MTLIVAVTLLRFPLAVFPGLFIILGLLVVSSVGLEDGLDMVGPGLNNATGATDGGGLVVSVGRVVAVCTPNRECVTREGAQFGVDCLERVAVGLAFEADSVVVLVEEDIRDAGRIDGFVVETRGDGIPERVANLLSGGDVVGRLRVESSGEFEADASVVAEVLAVDGFALDCAVFDDVDEVVDLRVILRVDFGIE